MRPLACWICGFESYREHECLVCCECCVLSGAGLCDELITRPEDFLRLWRVGECDLETSWMRRPWPHWGLLRQKKKINQLLVLHSRHFSGDNFWIGSWEILKPIWTLWRNTKFPVLAVNRNLVVHPIGNDYTDWVISVYKKRKSSRKPVGKFRTYLTAFGCRSFL